MTDDELRKLLADYHGPAASGHAAAPPRSVMKSRRFMGTPLRSRTTPYHIIA
jgi:hypothetical protein